MDNMKKIGTINYKDEKYANIFMIGSFVFFILIGVIFIILSKSRENNTVDSQWFLLGCFGYIILHELTHLFFMKIFSKEKVHISIKLPTISVGSSAKFSRTQFMIIILAPVVILGIALIACMVLFPKEYTFFFSILLILNFAGSGGDYFQWLKINKYPANTFFQDNSVETLVYQREIDEDMR